MIDQVLKWHPWRRSHRCPTQWLTLAISTALISGAIALSVPAQAAPTGELQLAPASPDHAIVGILPPEQDPLPLPLQLAKAVLRKAATDLGLPVRALSIVETESTGFDGCLGIYYPRQACTQIFIPGWRVILTDGKRGFVYHLDRTGNRILQNPTATAQIVPTFDSGDDLPPLESDVVFRATVSGGFFPQTITTTLTQDGTITRLVMAPNIRSQPVVIKKLTPQQVRAFQRLLESQRFPNLNRLAYPAPSGAADYQTTAFQALGTTVQFVDLEPFKLPRALNVTLRAWNTLTATTP